MRCVLIIFGALAFASAAASATFLLWPVFGDAPWEENKSSGDPLEVAAAFIEALGRNEEPPYGDAEAWVASTCGQSDREFTASFWSIIVEFHGADQLLSPHRYTVLGDGTAVVELELADGEPFLFELVEENGQWRVACATVSLALGDCVELAGGFEREVPCSQAHDAEVVDVVKMGGLDYPGADALAGFAERNCPPAADRYSYPNAETWAGGDRVIACLDEVAQR